MLIMQGKSKVKPLGGSSKCVLLTKWLDELKLEKGDEIYIALEIIGDKKRIIIEGVDK